MFIRLLELGGKICINGTATTNFSNWATHPSGRIWRNLWQASYQITSTGFNSTTGVTGAGSPIAGVIYYARGMVVNVAGFGDSITKGMATYRGEGFGFPACLALSAASIAVGSPAYEWSDFGWEGQSSTQIAQNITDAMAVTALPLHGP